MVAWRAGALPDGGDPAQEDARRPGRERDALVIERTRLTNTIKAELALWGIQGFKPGLKKAAEHLEALRTIEGESLPPNTLAKLHRLLERRRLIGEQIKVIEQGSSWIPGWWLFGRDEVRGDWLRGNR